MQQGVNRLPRGIRLTKIEALPWQVSWSTQHPATRWSVSYSPLGWDQTFFLGIIESTRKGARGHNRHSWWARTEKAAGLDEPSSTDEGVYIRTNRTLAVRALIDAWSRSK